MNDQVVLTILLVFEWFLKTRLTMELIHEGE